MLSMRQAASQGVIEAMTAIFGDDADLDGRDTEMRFRTLPDGRWTLAHPLHDGPGVLVVKGVPERIAVADLILALNGTAIIRKPEPSGVVLIGWTEIGAGAIIR